MSVNQDEGTNAARWRDRHRQNDNRIGASKESRQEFARAQHESEH